MGLYILVEDRVPRLTQNYGQSLLVGTELLLGVSGPLASLAAWLTLSQAMFTLLVFGLLRGWGLSARAAGLGTFFVLLCNVALSADYIYLIDSGSPLIYTGYTDTIGALATWLVLLCWLRVGRRRRKRTPAQLLLPALLACGWTITGPQSFILSAAVVGTRAFPRRRLPSPPCRGLFSSRPSPLAPPRAATLPSTGPPIPGCPA